MKVDFLDGYLCALTDTNEVHGKIIIRAFLSKNKKLKKLIKKKFNYMRNINLIKQKSYSNSVGLYYFLDKLILLEPYNFHKMNLKEKNNYKRYILSHLNDYIDIIFEKYNEDYISLSNINISIFKNNKEYFIVLTIIKNNTQLHLFFFKDKLNSKEIIKYFDKIVEYHDNDTKENIIKKHLKDEDVLLNGLTVRINKKIIEPIVKEAIEIGYFNKKMKQTLLQYFSEEKIVEFEKKLF